jgi:hypothetical protein
MLSTPDGRVIERQYNGTKLKMYHHLELLSRHDQAAAPDRGGNDNI